MKTIPTILMVAIISIAGLTMAQTTFESYWDGSGNFEIHFQSGDDATNDFWTGGAYIKGEYQAADQGNNPDIVDTTSVKTIADVENGFIEYRYTRTDSHTSMHGDIGQESYTYILTDDTANFRWQSWSNWGSYRTLNDEYTWAGIPSHNQIHATGNHLIHHYLYNGNNEGAEIIIDVDGTTDLTIKWEEADGNGFSFGEENKQRLSSIDTTGAGYFTMNAYADSMINTNFGIHTDGYLSIYAEFADGFHFGNFALEGS